MQKLPILNQPLKMQEPSLNKRYQLSSKKCYSKLMSSLKRKLQNSSMVKSQRSNENNLPNKLRSMLRFQIKINNWKRFCLKKRRELQKISKLSKRGLLQRKRSLKKNRRRQQINQRPGKTNLQSHQIVFSAYMLP